MNVQQFGVEKGNRGQPLLYHPIVGGNLQGSLPSTTEHVDVDPWQLFYWLNRPAVWAMRGVRSTSGLDTFLIASDGFPGVSDVAEWMVPIYGGDSDVGPGIDSDWARFSASVDSKELLFATFLWLDWDALSDPNAWGGKPVPHRSSVLASIRRAFRHGLERITDQFLSRPRTLLAGCSWRCRPRALWKSQVHRRPGSMPLPDDPDRM